MKDIEMMAVETGIDLDTIGQIDYIIWYVTEFFKRCPDYEWKNKNEITWEWISTSWSTREDYNAAFCLADESYILDILPKQGATKNDI